MSVTISTLTTSETFSEWVAKTNSLISFAQTAVTLDANNTGNFTLDGNISLQGTEDKIYASQIWPIPGSSDPVLVSGKLKVASDLILDVPEDTVAKIQFKENTVDTWKIETASDHSALIITDGTVNLSISNSGAITTNSGTRISNGMLPTNASLAGTLAVTGLSTLSGGIDVGSGNVDGLATLGTAGEPIQSAVMTTADINGGTIDGTTIGASSAASGNFTTISASSDATVGGNLSVTGTISGDVSGTATTASALNAQAITQVFNFIYPVGSVYICDVTSTPSILGIPGTWERVCEGRGIMGYDGGIAIDSATHDGVANETVLQLPTDGTSGTFNEGFAIGDTVDISGFTQGNGDFTVLGVSVYSMRINRDVADITGITQGSRTVKLAAGDTVLKKSGFNSITQSIAQLPSHTHLSNFRMENNSPIIDQTYATSVPSGEYLDHLDGGRSNGTTTQPTGGGDPMDITNRFQTLAVWRRTALT